MGNRSVTPACFYCGRTGQQLAPAGPGAAYPGRLACVDVAGCRDALLALLVAAYKEQA